MKDALEKILKGGTLSESEMMTAMRVLMEGKVGDDDTAAFLTALAGRGETVDEITGAARILREKALSISAPPDAVDCCGTGGDGIGTYNISTAVALVAAACGVPVAKHGNRASSSRSGAADVLEALGVNLNLSPHRAEESLRALNFTFLMAPRHHEAMKHVSAVRRKLKFRTIFNLLGPLANPAGTRLQLIGVSEARWLQPMAETLRRLGTRRAWVVHGGDGLDEITVTAPTRLMMLDEKGLTKATLSPADFGLETGSLDDLKGGDAAENAEALKDILSGAQNAYRDIVLANAAAVLVIHGTTPSVGEGVRRAAEAIDSGQALKTLNSYIDFTRQEIAA